MSALQAIGLSKVYGSGDTAVTALDSVDVTFTAGRFHAVMGASGSGKSTLMHCLAGLDRPTSGRVRIFDADLTRLAQVFSNLLNNAAKYMDRGGQIHLQAMRDHDEAVISVRDSGIGIPDHEQHRIFQKFSRLDNALSRKTEGTGLGLFLCKAIIEAHDGRIWFHKNPDGPGTTFTFSLPRN